MHIQISEYGRIDRKQLSPQQINALQHLDETHAEKNSGETVFDWAYCDYIKAKNWVGVIQVLGLTLEILPKLSAQDDPSSLRHWGKNLLYMLARAGLIPFSARDLASLRFERLTLLEAFIFLFAQSLTAELRKGLDQGYTNVQAVVPSLRGKLNVSEQVKLGMAKQHLFAVTYDNFDADTPINRILKFTCKKLIQASSLTETQTKLREVLFTLADTSDCQIGLSDFNSLQFNRSNARYKSLLQFCRLFLSGSSPSLSAGDESSFSVLFPMEQVFEGFIASIISSHLPELSLDGCEVLIQGVTGQSHLLKLHTPDGRSTKILPIRPDILIKERDGRIKTILDTKWKKLDRDIDNRRNNVAVSDIYQIYAYAQHFDCAHNILLYPAIDGASDKYYSLAASPDKILRTSLISLNYDLCDHEDCLLRDLHTILNLDSGLVAIAVAG